MSFGAVVCYVWVILSNSTVRSVGLVQTMYGLLTNWMMTIKMISIVMVGLAMTMVMNIIMMLTIVVIIIIANIIVVIVIIIIMNYVFCTIATFNEAPIYYFLYHYEKSIENSYDDISCVLCVFAVILIRVKFHHISGCDFHACVIAVGCQNGNATIFRGCEFHTHLITVYLLYVLWIIGLFQQRQFSNNIRLWAEVRGWPIIPEAVWYICWRQTRKSEPRTTVLIWRGLSSVGVYWITWGMGGETCHGKQSQGIIVML